MQREEQATKKEMASTKSDDVEIPLKLLKQLMIAGMLMIGSGHTQAASQPGNSGDNPTAQITATGDNDNSRDQGN